MAEAVTGRPMKWRYVDENRVGDHICYYSDLRKMKAHYPAWDITRSLDAYLRGNRRQLDGTTWCRRGGSMKLPDHGNLRLCRQLAGRVPAGAARGDLSISGIDNLMRAGLGDEPRAPPATAA